MTSKMIIGLTDRERTMHAENVGAMANIMLQVAESLLDPERDIETLTALIVMGMQAGNLDHLLKAVQQTTDISNPPDDVSGAENDKS